LKKRWYALVALSALLCQQALAQTSVLWTFNASSLGYGGIVQAGMTLVDVDGDGKLEAIAGTGAKWIYCLNGQDGTLKWVFGPTLKKVIKAPEVADINGDGQMEVVACDDAGGVWALAGSDGSLIWSFKTGKQTRVSPAIWDVNGDGRVEVIVSSRIGAVFCLDGVEGLPVWNATIGVGGKSSTVVADLDHDGDWEVVAKADGSTFVLDGKDGSLIWNASIEFVKAAANAAPAVYDANGDGIDDIFMCGGRNMTCLSGDGKSIIWTYPNVGKTTSGVLVADVNSDGRMEAIATTYDKIGTLLCFDATNGRLLWNFSWPGLLRYTNPAPVDVTGDGEINLVFGSLDGNLIVVNGLTGLREWNLSVGDDVASSPAVGDVNGDGKLDIVFGSHNGCVYALTTPVSSDPYEVEWGLFHYDTRNSGVLPMSEAGLFALATVVLGFVAIRRNRG